MARLFSAAVVFVAVLPSLASEPGQPLDCSDWVFLEPGYSCTVFAAIGALAEESPYLTKGTNKVTDNSGGLVALRETTCFGPGRINIVRHDGVAERVIGYIDPRPVVGQVRDAVVAKSSFPSFFNASGLQVVDLGCFEPGGQFAGRQLLDLSGVITFDAVNGRLLIPLKSYCDPVEFNCNPCPCPSLQVYGGGWWIAAITGFASLYDIQQSYVPPSSLSLRVPAIPEGFGAADHFDTYWGPLPGPIDFTQAQPLQCDYPASPPNVGDYLTVNDPLPNPDAGHGYYYVTAATYQGQTRYGRKGSGGRLSGRDPALLPGCIQPPGGR